MQQLPADKFLTGFWAGLLCGLGLPLHMLILCRSGRDTHLKDGTDDGQQRGAHGGEARQHSIAAEPVCSSGQCLLNGRRRLRAATRCRGVAVLREQAASCRTA